MANVFNACVYTGVTASSASLGAAYRAKHGTHDSIIISNNYLCFLIPALMEPGTSFETIGQLARSVYPYSLEVEPQRDVHEKVNSKFIDYHFDCCCFCLLGVPTNGQKS